MPAAAVFSEQSQEAAGALPDSVKLTRLLVTAATAFTQAETIRQSATRADGSAITEHAEYAKHLALEGFDKHRQFARRYRQSAEYTESVAYCARVGANEAPATPLIADEQLRWAIEDCAAAVRACHVLGAGRHHLADALERLTRGGADPRSIEEIELHAGAAEQVLRATKPARR